MYIHVVSITLVRVPYSSWVLIKVHLFTKPFTWQEYINIAHVLTGLGRSTALRFSELGYTVFALFPNETRQGAADSSDVSAVSGLIPLSPPILISPP